MSRKERKQQAQARPKKLVVIAVLGFVIVGFVVLRFMKSNSSSSSQSFSTPTVAPMFTKHGEITFISAQDEYVAKFDIEIADDEVRRELGLMGRPAMEEHQGMLFIFPAAREVSFWMKNTIMPLDMVMVNERSEVITIHKNTTPYSEQTYPSTGPTKYVVELNAGTTDEFGIKVGDKISWKRTL